MVHVPTTESAPEVIANPEVLATPESNTIVVKGSGKKKGKKAAAVTVPAEPVAEGATPPAVEGAVEAAPVAKKITERTYGKGLPNSGTTRTYDLPWSAKKVNVLSMLKKLGATSLTSLKGVKAVTDAAAVDGLALTSRDVRHYCYHAAAGGLVVVVEKPEGISGHGFYLTPAGVEVDYDAVRASLVKPVAAAPVVTPAAEVAPEATPAS